MSPPIHPLRVRVPETAATHLDEDSPTAVIRRWLHLALDSTSVHPPLAPAARYVSFRPTDDEHRALLAWAQRRGISENIPLTRLIAVAVHTGLVLDGVIDTGHQPTSLPEPERSEYAVRAAEVIARSDPDCPARPEQHTMLDQLGEAAETDAITLLEAATGSGKTRAFSAHAVALAQDGARTIIAAPTLTLVRSTCSELERLIAAAPGIRIATLFGRREFVSELRIARWLDERDEAPVAEAVREKVRAWLASQEDDGYRVGDLLERVPNAPIDLFTLTEHQDADDCRGAAAYERQWKHAEEAQIVVTSHTMLALHMQAIYSAYMQQVRESGHNIPEFEGNATERAVARAQWLEQSFGRPQGTIPFDPDCLLIDEGHLFDDMVRLALSSTLSLHAMRRHLSEVAHGLSSKAGGAAVHKTADAVTSAIHALGDVGAQNDFESISSNTHHGHAILVPLIERLAAAVTESRKAWKKNIPNELIQSQAALERDELLLGRAHSALKHGSRTQQIAVRWSPNKHYPSIDVSRTAIRLQMALLWQRARHAAVVSATLYHHTGSHMSAGYIATRLTLPRQRLLTQAAPIVPPWLRNGVTAYAPEPSPHKASSEHPLHPPRSSAETGAMAFWALALTAQIESIAATAKGGTLVVFGSYAAIDAVRKWLPYSSMDQSRLLVAESTDGPIGYRAKRDAFVASAAAGRRPVWMATGAIYQGENLTAPEGVPPAEDFVCTDLVVTRLPFGAYRPEADASDYVDAEHRMLFALRQIVGRLVRREGVTDRRLWLLDPRGTDVLAHKYAANVVSLLNEFPAREPLLVDKHEMRRIHAAHRAARAQAS